MSCHDMVIDRNMIPVILRAGTDQAFPNGKSCELDAVMDVISPIAKMILLNEQSENRRDTLSQWCAAVIRRMSPLANTVEAMQRSYDLYGVNGRNREMLDLRPADEIFERLRRESFGRGNDDSR